jgi:polyferredoxin
VLRPRTLIYSTVLVALTAAIVVALATRNPLKVDVLRDRGALAREAAPGVIENVYRLQLMNTDETPRRYTIRADGVPGLSVQGVQLPVSLGAAQSRMLAVRLQAPVAETASDTKRELHNIEFTVEAVDDPQVVRHEKSTFIIPH